MTPVTHPMQYRVHLPASGTVRDVATLTEALRVARPSARDGWGGTRISRLSDSVVLYACEPDEHGHYSALHRLRPRGLGR